MAASRSRLVVAALALAVTFSGLAVATEVSVVTTPSAAAVTAPETKLEHGDLDDRPVRPDSVSAMVTARVSDTPVEDVSQRTVDARVFANPDGTWTAEAYAEPQQVHDGDPATDPGIDGTGAWHAVDTTLVERDGGWGPKHANTDVVFSSGGVSTFATLTKGGHELAYGLGGAHTGLEAVDLPAPLVEGDTAVYPDIAPDVLPGVALVVRAIGTGFVHWIVLTQRPSATQAQDLSFPLTVTDTAKPASLNVVKQTGGGLKVTDEADKTVVSGAPPIAWDGSTTGPDETDPARVALRLIDKQSTGSRAADPSGSTAQSDETALEAGADTAVGDATEQVATTVTNDVATGVAQGPTGAHAPSSVVDLSVTPGFLTDTATVYPVTIDPSFVTGTKGDTWAQKPDYMGGQPSSTELRVGTKDGGAHIARSWITFSNNTWSGKHVTSAQLVLRNFDQSTCSAGRIQVGRIRQAWDPSTLTWGNQPTSVDAAVLGSGVNPTCPTNGSATWDITGIAQSWAYGTVPQYGLRLISNVETNSDTYRRYRSANYTLETAIRPHIDVTYNTFPAAAGTPGVTTSPASNAGYSISTTPTLSSKVSDADGSNVRAQFEVYPSSATVYSTSTQAWSGTSGYVPNNGTASIKTGVLPNGSYKVRAIAFDGTDFSRNSSNTAYVYSPWTTFTVDTIKPTARVSSNTYNNGDWMDAAPTAPVTFTFEGDSDVASFTYLLDGVTKTVAANSVGDATITWTPSTGGHKLVVTPKDRAGNTGTADPATFAWGYGQLSLTAPSADPVTTTSGTVWFEAGGPPEAGLAREKVHLQWRVAGSGLDSSAGWNDADMKGLKVTANAGEPIAVSGAWDTRTALKDGDVELDRRVPVTLDLQLCVDYTAGKQCTWANNPDARRQVLRVPHAFGDGFPVTGVEGGRVALWTGEFATDETDAGLPAGSTTLTVSRSHATDAGPGVSAASRVFGPGWVANLDGPDAGMADQQLIDATTVDGTLQVLDPEGTVVVLAPEAAFEDGLARRTTASLAAGAWYPIDDAGQESGLTATVSGSGASTQVALVEVDGTTTTFKATTAPTVPTSSASGAAVFVPASVQEAGEPGQTSYGYDGQGRVTRVTAPTPAGVTCPAATSTAELPAGCRALQFTYAATTTATSSTPGDYSGQVTKITGLVGSGDATTPVTHATDLAAYTYDSNGRLRTVTDPRNNLTTGYTWDPNGGTGWSGPGQTGTYTVPRLASTTPPGMEAIGYHYGDSGTDEAGKLTTVTRRRTTGDPAQGSDPTATLTTIVYGVPVTSADASIANSTDLPDLTQAKVDQWAFTPETSMPTPTSATAVFGLDHKPAGTTPDKVAAGDWRYADLSYVDDRGYEVYTGSYGAGDWRYTATEYDTHSNPVRVLDAGDIEAIDAGTLAPAQAGTLTVYNAAVTGLVTEANPTGQLLAEGSVVTDSYATARMVTYPDGTRALARPHTRIRYDQGAPHDGVDPTKGQAYALPTSTTVSLADPAAVSYGDLGDIYAGAPANTGGDAVGEPEPILSQTLTGYDNAVPATIAGTATGINTAQGGSCGVDCAEAGWALGLVSTSTTVMRGGYQTTPDPAVDIITRTSYDPAGRVVATEQPKTVAAHPTTPAPTSVGTRETVYYTAAANPRTSACGNKPAYDGLVCLTRYADAPSSGPDLVTTTYTAYDDYARPLTVVEISGTATRTTETTYRPDGQVATTATSMSGLSGSTPVPTLTYAYSPTTGALASTTPSTGQAISQTYDTWGRQLTYTTSSTGGAGGSAETTTTSYDAAGRVKTVTDPSLTGGATTTYAYDTTEAGATGEEHRGLLTKLTVDNPAGRDMTITGAYDATGRLIQQNLPGNVTQTTGYDTADQPITQNYTIGDGTSIAPLSWGQDHDGLGRVIGENTPDAGDVGSDSYLRSYHYDRAGRLTGVVDPAALIAGDVDCNIRDYGFDTNGNRTTLTRTPAGADGVCQDTSGNPTGVQTTTFGYDSADRLTGTSNAPYAYDAFGRVTTLPEADTPTARRGGTPGDVTLGYYDTDAAQSIAQAGTQTTFTLDATGRRSTATTTVGSGPDMTSTDVLRHYTDGSDNPGWTSTTSQTSSGPVTTIERYVGGLDGNLAATLHTGGTDNGVVQLTLVNLHGDTPAQITLPAAGDATGIDRWTTSDEYGNPLDAALTGRTATNDQATSGPNATVDADGIGYGWLGAKERATDASGLVLMGVRLYNPTTGAFTSTDPVYGGNTTAYAYPQDPINGYDLTGQWSWKRAFKTVMHAAAAAVEVCAYAPTMIGTACSGFEMGKHIYEGDWAAVADDAVGMAVGVVGGRLTAKLANKLSDHLATKAGGAFAQKVGKHANSPKRRKNLAQKANRRVVEYGFDGAMTATYEGVKFAAKQYANYRQNRANNAMAVHNNTDRRRM